jgi:hypothetical protein
MDGHHFDRLTRQFTASLSRRRLGGVLTALGLAAGLGRSSPTNARKGKKKKKKPKKCKNGAVKCGNACVNTKTNALHCGRCGRRCGIDAACVNGVCEGGGCQKDQCGALCVDLQDNDDHCGSCGNDCQGDLTCVNGECDCAEGTKCGNHCVNTQTDNDHCGECDEPCLGATFCQGGACLPDGNCTPTCRVDQLCDAGECVCPSGQVSCGPSGPCRECCFDLHCDGNPNGSECIADPGQPGNLICGCDQLAGNFPVLPCGPNGSCSLCCGEEECQQRHSEGWTCVYASAPGDIGNCRCDVQNGYTPCSNRCSNLQTSTRDCGSCDTRCCTGENCEEFLWEICVQGDCCRPISQFCQAHTDCCSGSCNFEFQQCQGPN